MPKKAMVRHSTLRNVKNAASLSTEKMETVMNFFREDVPMEPGAEEMFISTNHILDDHFEASHSIMDMPAPEGKESDKEVNKAF
jgi:hypothetical protein